MIKLLRANFSRCFSGNLFKILMFITVIFSAFVGVRHYLDIQTCKEIYDLTSNLSDIADHSVEEKIFNGTLFVFFAAAVFVGFYVGTEYSDGTMRNKIIVGHGRLQIYFANLIVCFVVNVIFLVSFIAIMLGFGLILMKDFCFVIVTAKQFIILLLCECLTFISATALFVAISMLIQSKAGGAVAILLVTILLYVAAIEITYPLREAEYYETYETQSIDEQTGEMTVAPVTERNPNYVSGIKRKIYIFLNDTLPLNQLSQIRLNSEDGYENASKMAACSCILIILASGVGVVLFRKKDLK